MPSVGELFGSLFKETASAVKTGLAPSEKPKEEKKKGGGLFGMFAQETLQEGDNPNRFANPEASDNEGEMGLQKRKEDP